MKKSIVFISIIAIILLVGSIYFVYNNNLNKYKLDTSSSTNITDTKKDIAMSNSDSTQTQVTNETSEISTPGKYIPYSEAELTDDINIIFFAAKWCPSCNTLDQDIQNNLSQIPSNVTIFNADYDQEQDLKVKYGVTIQHTLVQVDQNGNLINKWTGLYSLSGLDDVLDLI